MIEMKKLNNKGFSLVELIIVIAIMAILVGVVGTQVIPYLEKSRQGKDMQIFSAWNTAGMSAYSMNADRADATATTTFTIKSGSVAVANNGSAGEAAMLATFKELTGLDTNNFASFVSKEGKEKVKVVTVVVPAGGGNVVTTIYNTSETPADANISTVFAPIENK
jgi:type IV pilus assembly protein PilA